jgi:hypothetical protein
MEGGFGEMYFLYNKKGLGQEGRLLEFCWVMEKKSFNFFKLIKMSVFTLTVSATSLAALIFSIYFICCSERKQDKLIGYVLKIIKAYKN